MNDLSYSMMFDRQNNHDYRFKQGRVLVSWQDDGATNICNKCNNRFGLFNRHHCRLCGYLFCGGCCYQKTIIPTYLKIPIPPKEKDIDCSINPVLVCVDCNINLKQLSILSIIELLNNIDLTIKDIKVISQVCKTWNSYANYYLSRLREIQYNLPGIEHQLFEKKILWNNRTYFIGHNTWMTQLILSNEDKIPQMYDLLNEHFNNPKKNISCSKLMCHRKCNDNDDHILSLLNHNILSKEIIKYALSKANSWDSEKINLYLSFLIENGINSAYNDILEWLLEKSKYNLTLSNDLFWKIEIGLESESEMIKNKYKAFKISWEEKIPSSFKTKIYEGKEFIDIFKNNNDREDIIGRLNKKTNVIIPIDILKGTMKLIHNSIKVKDSFTRPIFFSATDINNNIYSYIYKVEDVRKDYIVMNVIKAMNNILIKDNLDLGLTIYKILPTSKDNGLIEIVPNCKTLQDIYLNNKDPSFLLNYIADSDMDISSQDLRSRFLKSTAGYVALIYILGVGDRHLENILIRNDARLFHIDFGFILGEDPKYISTPEMRITPEIIIALGGKESYYFKEFVSLCSDTIYNSIRRSINIIILILGVLTYSSPPIKPIINRNNFLKEIYKRFVPGEPYAKAKIKFMDKLEHSTNMSWKYKIIDTFHQSNQNGIIKAVSNIYHDTYSYFSTLFHKKNI